MRKESPLRKKNRPDTIVTRIGDGLEHLFDAWPDAVFLVDSDGRIQRVNKAAVEQFGYTAEQLTRLTVEDLVPERYRAGHAKHRVEFSAQPTQRIMASTVTFGCKRADGSEFPAQVNLEPVVVDGNTWTWAVVRDTSAEHRITSFSEVERRSLIGIGKLAASAVDFQSRQKEFGLLVRSMVPNESIIISTLKPDQKSLHVAYIDYDGVDDLAGVSPTPGSSWPIAGTTAERVLATRKPVMENFANAAEFVRRYPGAGPSSTQLNARSVINLPLMANQQVLGFLTLRSSRSIRYEADDLRRAQSIADVISGSVAQMELRRRQLLLEEQNSQLRLIGQIFSSSLNTSEVFAPFARAASQLINFNVAAIIRLEHSTNLATLDHMWFHDTTPVPGREPVWSYPAKGTMIHRHHKSREPVLVTHDTAEEVAAENPGAAHPGKTTHLLSTIIVPMLNTPTFSAAVFFQALKPHAFSPEDVEMAGKIGLTIKGTLASAYVHNREMDLASAREANLRAEYENKRLSEINETKSQFLGMLSHELKTPLTSITAFADMLFKNRHGHLDGREMQQVGIIKRNARLLEELITDLLELSRMESGRFELSHQAVFPAELIRSCIAELESQFAEKNQAIEQFASDPAVVMVADPKRLRQVLVNLLSNASKYSPGDTGITVKFTTTAGEFVFEVIDQGPGISPGDAERVFNLFDRGSNTEAHTQPGTGIGLYVARRIVEAHGGTISLRPLRGGGTVAKFTIPIAQSEQLAKIA